ncbi:MAG TPA: hypothetical protein VD969_18335 [Symbiobacteriaceae bacterium]|nr:hypothetical protein [Symbiobacteriaceae bacterium]
MQRNRKLAGAAAGVVIFVAGVIWAAGDMPVSLPPDGAAPSRDANVLGIEWAGGDSKPPETAPDGGEQGAGGLGIDWVDNGPAPSGGGSGQGSGLGIDWVGESSLGEAAIRGAYRQVFGREPSAAELTKELDRQSWDQSLRTIPNFMAALRAYLNSPGAQAEREATADRAVAAMPGSRLLVLNSGLIYDEMVRRLTVHASYQTAFGRAPSPDDERPWPERPTLDEMIAAHRSQIRREAALRKSVIERAYQNVWKRPPIAAELQRWDLDLQASGKTYAEVARAIAGDGDPIMPRAPQGLSHASRLRTHYWPASTTLSWQQLDDRTERFRILRQNQLTMLWTEVGTQAAKAAGQQVSFADEYQLDRAVYKVCAVNQHGEACSEPYATTDKPNQVQITSAKADSPTKLGIHWTRVGYGVTHTAVKRQKPDGGWEEVFRENATPYPYHHYYETVQPATKYVYVVCAYNSQGETCSPWVIIETPRPRVVAPADLKATARNQTDWLITWRPLTGDPTQLQRWNSQAGKWEALTERRTGYSSHLRQEPGSDAAYAYRVCAYNGNDEACSPILTLGKQFDHPTNFTNLDYGIYWFKCGTCRGSTKQSDGSVQSDAAKAVPGLSREYFDPARPTVIYVHGWAKNSVRESGRESMKSPTDQQDMMAAWKGWNVGVFYWNAFSDDDWGAEPRFAEGKIDKGEITWSQADGRGGSHFADTRVKDPASVLFAGAILEAMKEFKGPEFRIVGHSLGTQMAVMGTYYVSKSQSPHLTPGRVALLDPWISSGLRAEGLGGLIDQVKQSRGTVYEYYQTSIISQEHGHYGARAVTSRVHPNYVPWHEPGGAHAASIHWYFNSMGFVGEAPTAAMSLDKLRPLMSCGCRFEQVGGQDTKAVSDDRFQRHSK